MTPSHHIPHILLLVIYFNNSFYKSIIEHKKCFIPPLYGHSDYVKWNFIRLMKTENSVINKLWVRDFGNDILRIIIGIFNRINDYTKNLLYLGSGQ